MDVGASLQAKPLRNEASNRARFSTMGPGRIGRGCKEVGNEDGTLVFRLLRYSVLDDQVGRSP